MIILPKEFVPFILGDGKDVDEDAHYYVILTILLSVSTISIIGDLYIIYNYFTVGFVKETLTRLMAHQAFFDLIFCTSFLMQLSIHSDDENGPNLACKIQAFTQQFGQSSVMFDLLIAYVGYQIMLDKNERRHRKVFYFVECLIWVWAICTSIIAWPYYDITIDAGFCWISDHHGLRFYFLYLPVWLIFYYICIILILVAKRISEHSVELRNLQEEYLITRILRTEEILRSYLVIYLVTKSPATFFRIVASDDAITWEATLIMGTFWAITGFLHAWRFRRYMKEVVEAQEREYTQQQLLDPYLSPFTESPIQREVAAKIQPLITKEILFPHPLYFMAIILAYFILLPLVWFIFWIFAAYRDHTTQNELLKHLLWAMCVVFSIGIAIWSWTAEKWPIQFLGMYFLGILLLSPTLKLPLQRMIHNIEKTQHTRHQYVQRNFLNVILFTVVMLECVQIMAVPILNYNIQGKLSDYYFWFMIFLLGVRRKPTFRMCSMLISFLAWNFVYCFPLVVEIVSGQPFLDNFRRTRLYQVFHTVFVNGGIIYTIMGCAQVFGCVPDAIDEVTGDSFGGGVDLCNQEMRNGWIAISVVTLFQLLISCSLEPPGYRPSIIHPDIQIRDVPFFSCLKNFLFCVFIPLSSLLRYYSNSAGLIIWFIFSVIYAAANSIVRPCSFDAVNHIRTYFSLCSAWTSIIGFIYVFRFNQDQDLDNDHSSTDYYVLGVNIWGWAMLTFASFYWEKKVRRLYSIAQPLDFY